MTYNAGGLAEVSFVSNIGALNIPFSWSYNVCSSIGLVVTRWYCKCVSVFLSNPFLSVAVSRNAGSFYLQCKLF